MMKKGIGKAKGGTSNPPKNYPEIKACASPVVGGELTPKKETKQRGKGAAQRGFTSRGPMV